MKPRAIVKAVVGAPPVWQSVGALARWPGLRILMYHRVGQPGELFPGHDAATFAAQMRWLARNCTPIAPADIAAVSARPPLRRPPVLVTFDDGYRNYHDVAYPILRKVGIPALVFLATGMIDDGTPVWTDIVHWAVHATSLRAATLPWHEAPLPLDGPGDRRAAVQQLKQALKAVDDAERRARLDVLLDVLKVQGGWSRLDRQMLSWDEVRATMADTWYGGHTHSHPIMSRLTPTALDEEIALCRARLSAETKVTSPYFAYPNGTPADFNQETQQALERHGFTVAFTTIEGVNGRQPDMMALRRLPAAARNDADFAWLVAGLPR